VNFITAHDGFTLNDLVSYNDKHNEANGEENRDGESHNRSWNCGAEGPTEDPEINALRLRQKKNSQQSSQTENKLLDLERLFKIDPRLAMQKKSYFIVDRVREIGMRSR